MQSSLERQIVMTLLTHYYVPGLYVEERAIDVPLDWNGNTPGDCVKGETIRLFCRVVTSPEHAHDDLPLLVSVSYTHLTLPTN